MNILSAPAKANSTVSLSEGVTSKRFAGARGGDEYFIAVEAPPERDFAAQLVEVERRYCEALATLGLSPFTAVFRRVFLSDVANQSPAVEASHLFIDTPANPVAVSIVQQPPLSGVKIAVLAYHVDSAEPFVKQRVSAHYVSFEKQGLRHLWSTQLRAGGCDFAPSPVAAQTQKVFTDLIDVLSGAGGSLRDHCVRTWIYLRNVDVFYQDMVDSRTALFAQQGLTTDTHYISSTGIEGACAHRSDLVMMDAYSILGLAPQQMSFLNDFDRLCATKDYNVTFERGTRIAYADRAHYLIAGTASIDTAGRVVHPGDVLKQPDLALTNVEALLRSGSAGLDDMMHLIVYLRDPSDYATVKRVLTARFPGLPVIIVQGAVCRPEWLIEVECIAVTANDEPALPAF